MTALFKCDGCEGIMGDDAPRIALELVNEQPVTQTGDDGEMFAELVAIQGFGFVGSHHFCQMACLSSWAMGRAIDEVKPAGGVV